MTIPQPEWTINGEQVLLESWHASFSRGGCDRAGGTVTPEVARKVSQGDELVAWVGGVAKWNGPVSAKPLVYLGKAELQASGWVQKAQRSTGRLLYQSRDVSLWSEIGGVPYTMVPPGASKYQVGQEGGGLMFTREPGATFAIGDRNGVAVSAVGSPGGITGYAFDWVSDAASTTFNLRTDTFDFPNSGETADATFSLNAVSGTVNQGPSIAKEVLRLAIDRLSAATVGAETYRVLMTNVRVNGIASGDTFTTSQGVTDIGGRLGFDTSGVQPSGVNMLPADFTGSWWDALLYMAFLDDWAAPNIVPSDDGRERHILYHPWGDTVHDISLENAEFELNALEISNLVCVQYPHVGGFPAEVTVRPSDIGESDPLAGKDADNCLVISLQDPQPDATLATSVGQSLLRRALQPRYEGSGEIPELTDATIWDLRHGDHLNVADWGPLEARELPIDSVSLAAGRPARISIYSPGSELGLADRVGLAKARVFQSPELPILEAIEDAQAEPVGKKHCHSHGPNPKKSHHGEVSKKRYRHTHYHEHPGKTKIARHRKEEGTEPC
jgi:hypothetical protein